MSTLAIAGEGSWTDVAFDVLGVVTLGAGSLIGKAARFGRSLSIAKGARAQSVRTGMQTLRNAFNNPGLRGGLTNVGNFFRPSTYFSALDDGVRTFRHILGSTREVAKAPLTLEALPKLMVFGRDTVSMADDLARIGSDLGSVGRIHSGAVSALHGNTAASSVGLYIDSAMDELGGPFDAIDGFADQHTTREVQPLW